MNIFDFVHFDYVCVCVCVCVCVQISHMSIVCPALGQKKLLYYSMVIKHSQHTDCTKWNLTSSHPHIHFHDVPCAWSVGHIDTDVPCRTQHSTVTYSQHSDHLGSALTDDLHGLIPMSTAENFVLAMLHIWTIILQAALT